MFNPSDCVTNDATEEWIRFSWKLMSFLVNPAVAIALITAIGLVVVISWDNQQIRRWVTGCSFSLIALFIALPWVGFHLLPSFVPADSGKPADAIVILGRGNLLQTMRTQVAQELLAAGRAPLIFTSGQTDARLMREALAKYGVAQNQLEGEDCSRTTAENGLYTAQRLMPRGIKRIILVTDTPHMLRSSLIMRSVGFEVDHRPSPFPENFGRYRSQVFAAREAVSFITYGLSGRFRSKS